MSRLDKYNENEELDTHYSGTTTYGFSYKFGQNFSVFMYTEDLAKAVDSVQQAMNYESSQQNSHYDYNLVGEVFEAFHFNLMPQTWMGTTDNNWFFVPNTGMGTNKDSLICGVAFELTNDQLRQFFTDASVRLINKYQSLGHLQTTNEQTNTENVTE